jgi:hypothetical protein
MANVYGVEGSATYAVVIDNIDDLLSAFSANNTGEITSQDTRNAVYTLWEGGGGGAGEFFYTQTAPLTVRSTKSVGGIPDSITFSNVPLQELFDRMFFPSVATEFSISATPNPIQLGNTPIVTLTTNITQKSFPVISANVTSLLANNIPIFTDPANTVKRPTFFNDGESTNIPGVNVTQDTPTTYTLTINDGQSRATDVTVNWYFPRWFGSMDLNTLIGPNFNAANITPAQKTIILDTLNGNGDWRPVWEGSSNTAFTEFTGQISQAEISPKNAAQGSHLVAIYGASDYGGDGAPSSYRIADTFGAAAGAPPSVPFVSLGTQSVENRYGVIRNCAIWIKDYKSTAKVAIIIS